MYIEIAEHIIKIENLYPFTRNIAEDTQSLRWIRLMPPFRLRNLTLNRD